jgi:cbb3-type cytochrome c oxidase subunit III
MRLLFKSLFLLFAGAMAVNAVAAPVPLDEAGKIYRENCAVCHGDRGDGQSRARFGLDPQPRNFTTAAAAELSRERMINSVTKGRKGTAMVAWLGRLTPEQIEGVVDYIRTTFMQLAPTEAQLATDDPHLAAGKKIFEDNCRVCHGDRGNGATWTNSVLNPPPRNFTSPQARRVLTRERMLASVTYGRKGTAMMPFSTRLSKDEIESVVDYIRATFMKGPVVASGGIAELEAGQMGGHAAGGGHPHAPSSIGSGMAPHMGEKEKTAAVDMSAAMPMDLKGNYLRGRKFYLSNCFTCHGTRGDGLGPRAFFIEPKPRNFLNADSRSRLNRPALFNAIVIGLPGTVMPAWGKVLSPQQVADVAEFVFQDFIHPNPDEIVPQPGLEDDTRKESDAKKKAQ